MKFKFTTTPLRDLPLGSVVDGYCITHRSHTGLNALGYRCELPVQDNGYHTPSQPFENVLLVYTIEPAIEGVPV